MKQKKKKLISWSISAHASPFDLSPPPIDHDFLDAVKTAGAEVSGEGIVETFHTDEEALDAADNGVAVCIPFYFLIYLLMHLQQVNLRRWLLLVLDYQIVTHFRVSIKYFVVMCY